MKSFYLLFSFLWGCSLAEASTLHSNLLQEIFSQSSGLPSEQLSNINFRDFSFDVGVVGTPKIIASMNGGSAVLRWADDKSSLIQIKVYAQKRYDKYVEDLIIPMDIIKGISNDTSKALLDTNGLRDSWEIGKVSKVGIYCFGKHLPGLGPTPVFSGYFFDDYYGFCLQVSTPQNSGVSLGAVEKIGRRVIEEIASEIKTEGVSPNPLDKVDAPFAPTTRNDKNAGKVRDGEDTTPKPKPDQRSESKGNSQVASSRDFWMLGWIAAPALLAILLVWRKISKR